MATMKYIKPPQVGPEGLYTFEVTISFTERTFQTFLITSDSKTSIEKDITADFEDARKEHPELSDLNFEAIRIVELDDDDEIIQKGTLH